MLSGLVRKSDLAIVRAAVVVPAERERPPLALVSPSHEAWRHAAADAAGPRAVVVHDEHVPSLRVPVPALPTLAGRPQHVLDGAGVSAARAAELDGEGVGWVDVVTTEPFVLVVSRAHEVDDATAKKLGLLVDDRRHDRVLAPQVTA
jgi:hypothetical protein